MKKLYSWVPNFLTICNLLCGCLAIYFAIFRSFELVFWAIIAAAVFDFLDGFAARMLDARSPIGGDLDSLADMVSFGVAPAMTLFALLQVSIGATAVIMPYYAFAAFALAAFAALRLAKFNVDTRQTEEFRGLPTPAMSLFFVSLAVVYNNVWPLESLCGLSVLGVMLVLFCGLMVCDMPMFSFKFKSFGLKKNILRYLFAIFAVIMVLWLGFAAPAVIIMSYIVVSFVKFLAHR